jgi:hypothetical protein
MCGKARSERMEANRRNSNLSAEHPQDLRLLTRVPFPKSGQEMLAEDVLSEVLTHEADKQLIKLARNGALTSIRSRSRPSSTAVSLAARLPEGARRW